MKKNCKTCYKNDVIKSLKETIEMKNQTIAELNELLKNFTGIDVIKQTKVAK